MALIYLTHRPNHGETKIQLREESYSVGRSMMHTHNRSRAYLRVTLIVAGLISAAHAQVNSSRATAVQKTSPAPTVACDEGRAVALVEQQVAEARAFEKPVPQIAVMTRAADLLWPYREDAARSIFTEAFELASKYFAQNGQETRTEGRGMLVRMSDQRFVVLRAIAQHDANWARKLAERAAEETRRAAEKAAAQPSTADETGEKLVELASTLLPIDESAAVALVRSSFRYPLTSAHPLFFFALATKDQRAADALVADAISAYAARGTTEDFSYLSIYVFALQRNISRVPAWMPYQPPPNFPVNPALQEAFMKAFLARAQLIAQAPDQFSVGENVESWESSEMLSALVSLEPLVGGALPAYSQRVSTVKAAVEVAVGDRARAGAGDYRRSLKDDERFNDFDAMYEAAARETNPEEKDNAIAAVALSAKTLEQLDRLESLVGKMDDADARRQLLDWINYKRAQQLVKDNQFDEAKRAADRVEAMDQRAILYFEIARAAIKNLSDKGRARELLDEVLAAAAKAPVTDVRARAQLGVAHLYAEFDGLRALEVLADAVKTINQLSDPDLSRTYVLRRIEGKNFGVFASNIFPGFSLENAFREAGPHDFEGALLVARNLSDKTLRATAVIGLAAHCLEESAKKPTPKKLVTKPQPIKKQ